MQKIKQLYRKDYTGEEITVNLRWEGSDWRHQREFIPNRITNSQVSKHAVIIGNGDSRKAFNIDLLKYHRGFAFGAGAVQTYGCNASYRDYESTFQIITGKEMIDEIANSGYCDNHIVYANSQYIQNYPGKFYLMPQDPSYNSGALATYLACFDGHETVYLTGFDCSAGEGYNNNVYADTACYAPKNSGYSDVSWIRMQSAVMETYPDVEFRRVMPTPRWVCPPEWLALPNFKQITYQQFVLEINL